MNNQSTNAFGMNTPHRINSSDELVPRKFEIKSFVLSKKKYIYPSIKINKRNEENPKK